MNMRLYGLILLVISIVAALLFVPSENEGINLSIALGIVVGVHFIVRGGKDVE